MPRPPTPSLTPFTEQLPDVNNPSTWATRTPLFWNWATGPGYDNFTELLDYSESAIDFLDTALAGSETLIGAVAELNTSVAAIQAVGIDRIGVPFPVWDHITGCPIPSNAGTAKFIRLTAGQTGAGQYNNGLLGSESVSGSAPNITATATILVGPMAGQTVALVNTEQAFIRPRTASGTLQSGQIQSHTHNVDASPTVTGGTTFAGVTNTAVLNLVQSSLAVSATGGDETRPRNRSATFYLRIT